MKTQLLFKWLLLKVLILLFFINSYSQYSLNLGNQDAHIKIDHSSPIQLNYFTLECWIYIDANGTAIKSSSMADSSYPVIAKGIEEDELNPYINYYLGIRKSDRVLMADIESSSAEDIPGENQLLYGFTTLKLETWYHVSFSYNGSWLKLYLNGNPEAEIAYNKSIATESTANLAIGAVYTTGGTPQGSFQGRIDEVRIWDIALSQDLLRYYMNTELDETEAGLVLGVELNEGSGSIISYVSDESLNINLIGPGWSWENGAHFSMLIPPTCNDSPILTLGIISDPQYCDCDHGTTRYYRETLWKLPIALDTLENRNVDCIINIGDIIDRDYSSYDSILPIFDAITTPNFRILGNHEFEIDDTYKDTIVTRLKLPDYYFDTIFNNIKLIITDGTELAGYTRILHPELATEGDSMWNAMQGQVNAKTYGGGIGKTQIEWIESEIQESELIHQPVMLFCHFPLYPDSSLYNLWNAKEVYDRLGKYPNVIAYFAGHNHDGNYGFLNGIHHFTHKGLVETATINTFSIARIFRNRIELTGYGNQESRVFYFNPFTELTFNPDINTNLIHYPQDSGSLVSTINTTQEVYWKLYPDNSSGDNLYFKVNKDSIFLKTDVLPKHKTQFNPTLWGLSCHMDTVITSFNLDLDTVALVKIKPLPDTNILLSAGQVNIPISDYILDNSEYGLNFLVSGSNNKVTISISDTEIDITLLQGGYSTIYTQICDTFTGQCILDTFQITITDENNHPPELQIFDTLILEQNPSITPIPIDSLIKDPDGDSLQVISLGNCGFITVTEPYSITINATNPVYCAELFAVDDHRGALDTFELNCLVNAPPAFNLDVPREYIIQKKATTYHFNLDSIFHDPEGSLLTYHLDTAKPAYYLASLDNSTLHISPASTGIDSIQVEAADTYAATCTVWLIFDVNSMPLTTSAAIDTFLTGTTSMLKYNLSDLFTDIDPLQYEVLSSTGNITCNLIEDTLIIIPLVAGYDSLTIAANDQRGGISFLQIKLQINAAPEIVAEIPNYNLILGVDTLVLILNDFFNDPETDSLIYSVDIENSNLASISHVENIYYIIPGDTGNTNISITCHDIYLESVSQTFNLKITDIVSSLSDKHTFPQQIFIYPNPTDNEFTLRLENFTICEKVNIELRDSYGRLIKTMYSGNLVSNNQNSLIRENFPAPGIYYLSVKQKSFYMVESIVVK